MLLITVIVIWVSFNLGFIAGCVIGVWERPLKPNSPDLDKRTNGCSHNYPSLKPGLEGDEGEHAEEK